MKKIILLIIVFLTFIVLPFSVSAQKYSEKIKVEKINPDSQLTYGIKRLKEKFILFTKINPRKKVDYYKILLSNRLNEFLYIVDSKNIAYIEKSSQRYETTAGQLAEFIIEKNVKDEIGSTIELISLHRSIIDKLKNDFTFDSLEWRLLMNGFNSLEIYLDKLSSFKN